MNAKNAGTTWLAAGWMLLAFCAAACHSVPQDQPASSVPQATEGHGSLPEQGWVWAKGDGEHPAAVIVVGTSGGKLVAQMLMTPAANPRDYAHGFAIPMTEVESTDRRITFRLKPVDASIKPVKTIIEFEAPPSGEVVTGKIGMEAVDAWRVEAKREDVEGQRVPLEFRSEPWPVAPTWEQYQAVAEKQQDAAATSADKIWSGRCSENCRPGPLKYGLGDCRIEILTHGTKLVSCSVVERRKPADGGRRVLFEMTELKGTIRSGTGVAVVNGVRHPYCIRSEERSAGCDVRIADDCGAVHPPAAAPYFSANLYDQPVEKQR